ncbi:MAG: helix-turn-helix transcriptional regulator [Deltaproteobacteria bacterium]|jgi:transcriptional regulator with XRE-family HTH domain|nr:MAG: helix-turn-helix transcriptional regulator [Deltaproteobacteria bacterium]
MSDENVNRSIRELRLRLGMTQEEFAHAVAVTFSTVNRWENGHAKPSKLARRAIEALARRGAPRREGTGSGDRMGGESDRLADAAMVVEPHQSHQ